MRFLRHAGHGLRFRLHTVFFPFCPVRYTSIRQSAFSFRLLQLTRSRSGVLSFHLLPFTLNRMGIFSFRLNTFGLYGNVLPHILSFMPHAVVAFHVQPYRQVFRQHPVQVHGNTLHTSAVRIYHRRFSVRVGAPLRIGMYDTLRVVGEIGVVRQSAVMFRLYDGQNPFLLCQSLLLQVFLQDDQVAAGFRACIVGKQVVGQSYCRYQIRLAEHLVPDGNPRTVQHPLRGDERHDAAVTHRIQTFQKEIVMDGFLCRTSAEGCAAAELRIEHSEIPERDIGDGKVKMVQKRLFYFLETLRAYLLLRVQAAQQLACQQVFLKCHHLRLRIVRQYRADERAHTRRRLQHQPWAYLAVVQHVRYGVRNGLRRIECRQHRCLQRVHIPPVLRFVPAVLPYQTVQLHRRGKQFEI